MIDAPSCSRVTIHRKGEQYCPVCGRAIIADNIKEVESGEHNGYLFIHDDIIHSDSDIEALGRGLQ